MEYVIGTYVIRVSPVEQGRIAVDKASGVRSREWKTSSLTDEQFAGTVANRIEMLKTPPPKPERVRWFERWEEDPVDDDPDDF